MPAKGVRKVVGSVPLLQPRQAALPQLAPPSPAAAAAPAIPPLAPASPAPHGPTPSSAAALELASPFGPQLLAGLLGEEGGAGWGGSGGGSGSGEAEEEDPLAFYASGGGLDSLGDFDGEGGEGFDSDYTSLLASFETVAKLWQ